MSEPSFTIVTGFQTGADRAAADAAIETGTPHRGWVPKGRLAEDGPVSMAYNAEETTSDRYQARTERNVRDSDATVIFSHGQLGGGSRLTRELAERHGKPWLHIDFNEHSPKEAAAVLARWVAEGGFEALNVAGSRASYDPALYDKVYETMVTVLQEREPRAKRRKQPSTGNPRLRRIRRQT